MKKGLGIHDYIGEEASSEYQGQIIRQSEEARIKSILIQLLEITISEVVKAAALTVPAVTNMPQADAEAAITALGLVSSVTTAKQ